MGLELQAHFARRGLGIQGGGGLRKSKQHKTAAGTRLALATHTKCAYRVQLLAPTECSFAHTHTRTHIGGILHVCMHVCT